MKNEVEVVTPQGVAGADPQRQFGVMPTSEGCYADRVKQELAGPERAAIQYKIMAEPWYLPIVNSLPSGLVGATVVYYFGIRKLRAQRRINFLERQLSEFYAPLAGMRTQVRAKTELRQKVSAAANAAWQEICQSYGHRPMEDHEERYAPFGKIIEYDNDQLKSELVPMYRQMLALFTEKYHLAGPDTRAFYQEFLEFVEIWNRWLADSLPGEVVGKLGYDEEKVNPFYEHLESKMQQLQDEIARG